MFKDLVKSLKSYVSVISVMIYSYMDKHYMIIKVKVKDKFLRYENLLDFEYLSELLSEFEYENVSMFNNEYGFYGYELIVKGGITNE
ncbi:MAG: hypothetical protein QXS19_06655 [Candidatus Methanomethylicia archaeon]